MDEPSQTAREALRRYHAAAGLSPPARARVWRAIEGALDEAPATVAPRRRAAWPLVLGTALAAAVVIVVCGARERLAETARTSVEGAAYQVDPDERQLPTLRSIPEVRPVVDVGATRPRPRAIEAAPGPDLAAEMALLRRARSALDAGDAAASLRALDEHTRSFAAGQMAQDRLRLRIEALCALGDRATAQAEARSFLEAHPDSPHSSRVEKLCRDP